MKIFTTASLDTTAARHVRSSAEHGWIHRKCNMQHDWNQYAAKRRSFSLRNRFPSWKSSVSDFCCILLSGDWRFSRRSFPLQYVNWTWNRNQDRGRSCQQLCRQRLNSPPVDYASSLRRICNIKCQLQSPKRLSVLKIVSDRFLFHITEWRLTIFKTDVSLSSNLPYKVRLVKIMYMKSTKITFS